MTSCGPPRSCRTARFANPKIEFLWNHTVTAIQGSDKVEGVQVTSTVDGSVSDLAVTGLFVAIGHRPNTDIFQGVLDMEDNGYLITQPDSSYTNIPGVFACGDVKDQIYRQAITAAGSGCMAAIDAERWLEAQEDEQPSSPEAHWAPTQAATADA